MFWFLLTAAGITTLCILVMILDYAPEDTGDDFVFRPGLRQSGPPVPPPVARRDRPFRASERTRGDQ